MTTIVTGAAGFIGSHVAAALLERGEQVLGIDNLNDYYSVELKKARLGRLADNPGFRFIQADVSDRAAIAGAFAGAGRITRIAHLAAQPGVRYSLENPYAYVEANVMGQVVLLEAARHLDGLEHFVYASTSSVYGANDKLPFSVEDRVDRPVSLYAATKRAGELIAYNYCHTLGVTATALRFFTVYGPWGRPDMAPCLFCDAIAKGRPIRVFNGGNMERDFTYVDDVAAGVVAALDRPAAPDALGVRHAVYNLGNNRAEKLMRFIELIQQAMGREAQLQFEPMQPGDVRATFADIETSRRDLGYAPRTPIETGVPRFVAWYKRYHGLD